MTIPALTAVRYGFALLFGLSVAVSFAGMPRTRKNYLTVLIFALILFIPQIISTLFFGMETTQRIYPLITHLPVTAFIVVYLKRSWSVSAACMFSSYLCCQAPRWISSVAGTIFSSMAANYIFYVIAVFLVYYFLQKYVADSVWKLMKRSNRSALLFGAVPFFYYIFDYVTTIYTNLLYTGNRGAVQFMPSVMSILFFVFIILYFSETQKQTIAQRERDMLAAQLHHARNEFASLRQSQLSAATYRHDMRHHITHLQALAAEGSLDKISAYLRTVQSDIDAITPVRFCENETVNLILSSFSAKADQAAVTLTVDARLPATISISDTELCSLLSNGLENAINAAAAVPKPEKKTVTVFVWIQAGKLMISIENTYTGSVTMDNGLPLSPQEDHGYGTRSILAIAEAHGGHATFSAGDQFFALRIILPLESQALQNPVTAAH